MFDCYTIPPSDPNSKARKAAAATTGGERWEGRPSKLQQRRDSRRQRAQEEKMKRVKVRSFSKAGLFGSKGMMDQGDEGEEEDEGEDELQCEHFFECSGCFFRSGCVFRSCSLCVGLGGRLSA